MGKDNVGWCLIGPMGVCWSCAFFKKYDLECQCMKQEYCRSRPGCRDYSKCQPYLGVSAAEVEGAVADVMSNDTISSYDSLITLNDKLDVEALKKCLVHDGTWSVEAETCSIDVSGFPNVADEDHELSEAIEKVDIATAQKFITKYHLRPVTGVQRRQILGNNIEDVDPRYNPSTVIAMVSGIAFLFAIWVLAWVMMRKWAQYLKSLPRVELKDPAVVADYKDEVVEEGT